MERIWMDRVEQKIRQLHQVRTYIEMRIDIMSPRAWQHMIMMMMIGPLGYAGIYVCRYCTDTRVFDNKGGHVTCGNSWQVHDENRFLTGCDILRSQNNYNGQYYNKVVMYPHPCDSQPSCTCPPLLSDTRYVHVPSSQFYEQTPLILDIHACIVQYYVRWYSPQNIYQRTH